MKISILPRFVALRSMLNNKYLQQLQGEGESQAGSLQFSAEEVASLFTKFEVEPAKSDRRFVHLKCCSNNKYWVASSSDGIVTADADKAEEDQSKSSCTLFKPIVANIDDENDLNTFRFKSASLGKYAVLLKQQDLLGCADDKDTADVFTVIEWNSITETESKEDPSVVASRSIHIHSLQFHTFGGVISGQRYFPIASKFAANTTDDSSDVTFEFVRRDTKTATWRNSDPTIVGAQTTLTSGIPFVTEGTIQISPQETFSYNWGLSRTVAANVTQHYPVTVPPRSAVTVILIVGESTCEVPFSYTQNALSFHDGSCTSTTSSDLLFDHWFQDLP